MRIVWISGWASDISQWKTEITARFPQHAHTFLDYGDLLPEPDTLWERHPGLARADHIVAWSMGTLALLRQVQFKPSSQRWTLVAPIFDFCAPDIGWSRRTVHRMASQVRVDPRATLAQFATLMGPAPPTTVAAWLERALRYTPEQLAMGLLYLAEKNAASPHQSTDGMIRYLWGSSDRVVPPMQQRCLGPQAHIPPVVLEDLGHWLLPYLEHIA